MSKNVSDNNNAAMLLMSHVGDIRDVKYLKKKIKGNTVQSNVTHVGDVRDLRITLCIIIQTIRIKKYFELMLRIT